MRLLANKLYLSLVGVIAVFCATFAYLLTQTLDTPLFNRPDTIDVLMPSTGALFEGSAVTYRGMKIGRITEIRLDSAGRVRATATITTPVDIPASSAVKVRGLSPVGEQYLDFQPTTASGPYLRNGSRVEAKAGDLPKTLASTVINVNKLLDEIDEDDLRTALVGISTALDGTGDDFGRLADQGYLILQTLDSRWPQTQRLLTNANVLLKDGANNADRIRDIAGDSKKLGNFLRDLNPTVRDMLEDGPEDLEQLLFVIKVLDEVLPPFTDRVIKVSDIVIHRDPHFRALLQSYEPGIRTLGSAFYDNAARGHILLQEDYRCVYDGPHVPQQDTVTHPVYPNGHCIAPKGRVVRGAHNAPPPLP